MKILNEVKLQLEAAMESTNEANKIAMEKLEKFLEKQKSGESLSPVENELLLAHSLGELLKCAEKVKKHVNCPKICKKWRWNALMRMFTFFPRFFQENPPLPFQSSPGEPNPPSWANCVFLCYLRHLPPNRSQNSINNKENWFSPQHFHFAAIHLTPPPAPPAAVTINCNCINNSITWLSAPKRR